MTEVNTALADGHFRKDGQMIPTLQFPRTLVHEMMENTIGVDTVDYGSPMRSTCTPDIVPFKLLKVKIMKEATTKRQKKSNRNIKNREPMD